MKPDQFECPECNSVMTVEEDKHVCTECDKELTISEANDLFEDGKLVGIFEEKDEDEDMDDKDKDKDDSSEEEMEEEEGKTKKESVDWTKDLKIDMSEAVDALFNGEELSEENKERVQLVFETAVKAKVKEVAKNIEEAKDEEFAAKEKEIKEDFNKKIDEYLDYVVSEWMEENKLAIENGMKFEAMEKFMEGLETLISESPVNLPEDRFDVLEKMAAELEEVKTKLDEEINKNIEAKKVIKENVRKDIFNEVSEGLADTQVEKLKSLAEEVSAENDEEYKSKLESLKESYFKKKPSKEDKDLNLNEEHENLDEGVEDDDGEDDLIKRASRHLKKKD